MANQFFGNQLSNPPSTATKVLLCLHELGSEWLEPVAVSIGPHYGMVEPFRGCVTVPYAVGLEERRHA